MIYPRFFRRSLRCVVWAVLCCGAVSFSIPIQSDTLPSRLGNDEFWSLIGSLSEAEGYFRSDNLVSNETGFQKAVEELLNRGATGGAYLGVGPEQNFSYIAALKPRIAFIPDIRRGNLRLHLMYKALFELSEDRAGFLSRLFSRKRPGNVNAESTIRQLIAAFHDAELETEAGYSANLNAILDILVEDRGFLLSREDVAGIGSMYRSFYSYGLEITYSSSQSKGPYGNPTFADLMTGGNESGEGSYLSSEEAFASVKDLEERNLVVPVIADFAGPNSIRAIGKYLREHNAAVSVFYVSNVERYLDDVWGDFCKNVAALPLNEKSTFVRWTGNFKGGGHSFGSILEEIKPGLLPP